MGRDGFRHEALIYRDEDDFLAGTVPYLWDALEAGEAVLVVVRREKAALLQGELGAEADAIRFGDMRELGRNPARLIPLWRDFLDEHEDRVIRGIGEPLWPGRGAAEVDECERHESLVNTAFAGRRPALSLLCSYDSSAFRDEVLSAVSHSHTGVERDGEMAPSGAFEPQRDCFAGDLPDRPGREQGFEFDRTGLFDVRQRVTWAAKSAGASQQATTDLVVAASELAANSIVHGGGTGTLYVWREAGRLLVEVEDSGRIEEPLVGRVRPQPTQVGGRGLWLANQFCDLVQIRSGVAGTAVRLHMDLAG
ncbi:MAG TPA: anti-sigma factor RsbA family regulatory protein [Solirubrobacterales bacterium]|nr:anti-sigma factor RsbA family regulatory protein [Solirubrobacterales bacterium]